MNTQLIDPRTFTNAALPERYEAAKQALSECVRIDECKDWADKAKALASYARQRDDLELRNYADRIRARAIRRCGELLMQIEPAKTGPKLQDGNGLQLGRTAAAYAAGLSERKRKEALRLASIATGEFERQLKSEQPPTLEALAQLGTEKKPSKLTAEQRAAEFALAQLIALSRFCITHSARSSARSLRSVRVDEARQTVARLDRWLDEFVVNLNGREQ